MENIVLTTFNIGEIGVYHVFWIWDNAMMLTVPFSVALALSEAFACDVNEFPLTLVLSWYEQKAVCILLTLLHLGIKNIYLGPTLPAFVSPNVLNFLVENYQIHPISTRRKRFGTNFSQSVIIL